LPRCHDGGDFGLCVVLLNSGRHNCGRSVIDWAGSKDTVLTGRIQPQLHVVSAFHHMKKPEFGYAPGDIAISKGRRDRLYDPITKSTSSFVLNASWSLLLYHFDKAFKAAADQALDTLEETMLLVSEDLESRHKQASDSRSSLRKFSNRSDASVR
jgi:hypothetical protein